MIMRFDVSPIEDSSKYISNSYRVRISGPATIVVENQPELLPNASNYNINEEYIFKLEMMVLIKRWRDEVKYMSSLSDMVSHEDYKAISSKDRRAISILLNELRDRPHYWFDALQKLVKNNLDIVVNPVRKADRGNLSAMTDAWLEWGKRNGFCV